jgi:ribosomal-protein-serine acetyltransferase
VICYNNLPVGRIGIYYIDLQNRTGTIGYWVDRDFQGRGIASKACAALLPFGFEKLNLNRIEIKCSAQNTKSQAIPERLNFVKEAVLKQAEYINNAFNDLYLYAMVKEDWQKNNSPEDES